MARPSTAAGSRKVLYIAQNHPWEPWSSSGFLPAICSEMKRRDALLAALPFYATSAAGGLGLGPFFRVGQSLKRRLGLEEKHAPWEREKDGYLGELLRTLPPDSPVVYQYILPAYDDALQHSRFLFQDLSAYDAVETRSYGHEEMTQEDFERHVARLEAAYAGAEAIMTFSSYAADSLTRDFGVPRDRITPIGCGPARSKRALSRNTVDRYAAARILFVGRNWERKGGPLLMDALRIVRKAIPHATVHIVGPLECPVSGDGIVFHGRVSDDELGRLFAESSVFCMPAICEAWGMVYTEAADVGLPIAGIDAWAMRDIVVPGRTGELAQERTPEELAAALIKLLEEPERLCQMGKDAQRYVDRVLQWPQVVDRLLGCVLPESLDGRKPVPLESGYRTLDDDGA